MRSNLRVYLVFAFLTFILATSAPAEGKRKAKNKPTFSALVEENFARWDKNHDGVLSVKEIDDLVRNPKVTGDEAAAVAAIHVFQRSHRKNPVAITRSVLLVQPGKDDPGRRDKAQKRPHFAANFQSFRNHIRKAPREIFATPESPSLIGFSQGHLGDCYFLAAVTAAINANQRAVRQMFHPRPDGSCDVLFYSGHRLRIAKLTDAEIALSSNAHDQGVWLNVVERAFGEVKLQMRNARKESKEQLDLDVISHGGYTGEAIEVLCGTRAKTISIRKGKGHNPPSPGEILRHKVELHTYLANALPRRFLFCCSVGSGGKGKYPPGIVSGHAYAILGYNPRTQVVTVMNPWGNHFEPKGTPGLANGYHTKGGRFDVPLHELLQIVDAMYFQTAMPPKPKKR